MEIFVQLIVGIAWPVTILVIVIIFRKNLAAAAAKLSKIRYKDFEAEFERTLSDLERQKPSLVLPPATEKLETRSLANRRKEITALAAVSPRATIMEAWLELERSVLEVARRADVPIERGFGAVTRVLAKREILPSDYVKNIEELRRLRNLAAHEPDFTISETEARQFVYVTLEIAASVELLWLEWAERLKRNDS